MEKEVEVRWGKKTKSLSRARSLFRSPPTHLSQHAPHPDVALLHTPRRLRDLVLHRHGQHRLIDERVPDGAGDLRQLAEPALDVGEGAAVLPRRGVLELLLYCWCA